MLGLLINGLVFLAPLLIYIITGIDTNNTESAFTILLTLAVLYTIGNIVASSVMIYCQLDAIERVTEQRNKKLIYVSQRDELIEQATGYLGKYPEHEKELFKLISAKNPGATISFLGALPEIKSADVLKTLVLDVQQFHSSVFTQDLRIEELKREIRVRARNPFFILGYAMPSYKDEKMREEK